MYLSLLSIITYSIRQLVNIYLILSFQNSFVNY